MSRPAFASPPQLFGRRKASFAAPVQTDRTAWSDELRLFALTYALGFVAVSTWIA